VEPAQSERPLSERPKREPALVPAARSAVAPERVKKRAFANLLRRTALLLVALGLLASIVMAWLPKPVPVELATVDEGPLLVTVDEDGRTRVKDRYVVSAPLMANLARIELTPGDSVEPGTVLARLVPLDPPLLDERTRAQAEARVAAANAGRRQASSAVERVRSAYAYAQREAERQRGLSGSGAAAANVVERAELEERSAREELASAEFGARVAENDLRMAEAALGRLGKPQAKDDEQLELTSPVKGRVLRVIQQSEGVVQPGTPLIEVGDPAALEIVVDVLTSDAVHVREGARTTIERWGGEQALRAHVRVVEPSAFPKVSSLGVEEQRVNVVIDLDEPREVWAALGDGYRVEAKIATWEAPKVLSVAATAAFRRGEDWAVFRVADGVARVVKFEVGQRNADRVEVVRGLAKGDVVVAHPSERLSDGIGVEKR
jgi:HlyD family secretion protein